MATAFENFVNTELPKRIATNESPTTPQAGDIPVFSGVGLLTESKTPSEAGLATETFATDAATTAGTNAKSYADSLVTSIYKFQTTYDPQITGNFPTTANTIGGVAVKKGFTWVVTGITGQYTFQGVTVDNGDTLLALVDDASATTSADWHITEKNLGYTPENVSNKATNLTSPDNTKYPTTQAVVTALGDKQNSLPAPTGTTKFLREDLTWQDLIVSADNVDETVNRVFLSPAQKTSLLSIVGNDRATANTESYVCNDFDGNRAGDFIQYNAASSNINVGLLHDSTPIHGQNFNGVLRLKPTATSWSGIVTTEPSVGSNNCFWFDGHTVDVCMRFYVKDNTSNTFTSFKIIFGFLEGTTASISSSDGFCIEYDITNALFNFITTRAAASSADTLSAGGYNFKNAWGVFRIKRTNTSIEFFVNDMTTPIKTFTTNLARGGKHFACVFSSSGSSNNADDSSLIIDLIDKYESYPSRGIV